ncbi:hypothetical protein ACSSS7_003214 [Eimeria intestinalis]
MWQRKTLKNAAFAVLLSVMATISVLFVCYRASRARVGTAFLGRALSSGPPHDDEEGDHDQSRLFEACLDLEDEFGFSGWAPSSRGEEREAVAVLAESMRRAAEDFESSRQDPASWKSMITFEASQGFLPFLDPLEPSWRTASPISPNISEAFLAAPLQQTFSGSPRQESPLSPLELGFYDVHALLSQTQAGAAASTESDIEGLHGPRASRTLSGAHSSQGPGTPGHGSIPRAPGTPRDSVAPPAKQTAPREAFDNAPSVGSGRGRKRKGKQPESGGAGETRGKRERQNHFALEFALMQHPKGLAWVPRAKKSADEHLKPVPSSPAGQKRSVSSSSSVTPESVQVEESTQSPPGDAVRPSTSREVSSAAEASVPESPGLPQPSTSSIEVILLSGDVIRIPHPPLPMPADTDMYYHLPANVPTSGFPQFDADRALFCPRKARRLCDNLAVARRLLAQQSLDSNEARLLMLLGERLTKYLLSFHKSHLNRVPPFRACESLGVRYLCFDFLVSLIQLFGPAANPQAWFPQLVEEIPTEYTRVLGPKGGRGKHFVSFSHRLSAALHLLKQGRRPSAEVTFMLKRDLFDLSTGPGFFRMTEWNDWRESGKGV